MHKEEERRYKFCRPSLLFRPWPNTRLPCRREDQGQGRGRGGSEVGISNEPMRGARVYECGGERSAELGGRSGGSVRFCVVNKRRPTARRIQKRRRLKFTIFIS